MRGNKTRKWVAACLCGALLLTGLTGCGKQPQQEINFVTVEDGVVQMEQTAELADWSYDLLRQMTALQQEDVLLSPVSAWLALSMTGQGAAGDTAQAFEDFFHDVTPEQQRQIAAWYLQGLEKSLDGTTQIKLANSVWCDDEITINTEFIQQLQAYYRALVMQQDLQEEDAVKRVNGWIEKATDGQIPHILQEIDADAVMLLVNGLSLDAAWQQPFESTDTYTEPFYTATGVEQRMEFLHQRYAQADYLQWETGQGIVLPYTDGRLALVALLPAESSSCDAVVQQLSADWMQQLLAQKLPQRSVQLALPKFTMESELNLNEVCQAMGLAVAFDGEQADFSKLGTSEKGNIAIGRVLQNCRLTVAEEGTQAAAATVVEMRSEGALESPADEVVLTLNRPFVYLIFDQEAQLPLFLGIYQGQA